MSGRRAMALLARGRRRAEGLMVDECVITRVSGEAGPIDPDTGLRDPAPRETIYTGKCKVQTWEPHESKPQAGEHVWTVQRYFVHIPVGSAPIEVDDRIEVTESAMSPDLAGRIYRVSGLHQKSLSTAHRLLVDEVTG